MSPSMLTLKITSNTFSYRNPLFLTSAPSILVVPPSAIYGLFAAIIGKGCNDVLENRKIIKRDVQDKINNLRIFYPVSFSGENIKIMNVVSFGISRFNADKEKWGKSWNTPMTYTYVLNLEMFVRVECSNELATELEKRVENSESVFTPYVGSSENLVKEISLVEEEEIRTRDIIEMKEISSISEIEENDVILHLGYLPAGYDDEGNWIKKRYALVKTKWL